MQISFFEEFPTKKNLNKLNLIDFPIKLYLAASSLEEFVQLTKKIDNEQVKEIIYWPILSKREGYWISPFTKRKALQRILGELEGAKVSVMLDLELPTTKNTTLYFTQFLNFLKNKRMIRKFIGNYSKKI